MWCHAQYLSGGLAEGRGFCYSGASWASGGENTGCCICFVSVLLIVGFFSLCRSVKLFSTQPTSFAFSFWFSSPSQWGGGRSEKATAWFFVANWGWTTTSNDVDIGKFNFFLWKKTSQITNEVIPKNARRVWFSGTSSEMACCSIRMSSHNICPNSCFYKSNPGILTMKLIGFSSVKNIFNPFQDLILIERFFSTGLYVHNWYF